MVEPKITIDGQALSDEQATVIRIALTHFQQQMSEDALLDESGYARSAAISYRELAADIICIIGKSARASRGQN